MRAVGAYRRAAVLTGIGRHRIFFGDLRAVLPRALRRRRRRTRLPEMGHLMVFVVAVADPTVDPMVGLVLVEFVGRGPDEGG